MGYEIKKIADRKILWICMLISVLLILITVGFPLFGSYYVDGERIGSNYEIFQVDAAYQKALNGRPVDEMLLKEMQEAYSRVPLDAEDYSLTEEYQKYARPYSAIFNYVRQTTGMTGVEVLAWASDAEDLFAKSLERQETRWEFYQLSEGEKEFWRSQEDKIENPVIFQYAGGYDVLLSAVYTVGLIAIFMVAVCLAGAFPVEHVKKTDQLILSSRYGRAEIYRAKFMAGVLVAFFMSLVFVLVTFVLAFTLYGAEGFDAAFQLVYAGSSCPMSAGQAVLIAYLQVLVAGVFTGAFVMMLSEVLHSSVGTLAITIGIILIPMLIYMPEEYRLPAQLWSYLPSEVVAVWSMYSPYTVLIAGGRFQTWQFVPALYLVLGIGAWFVTKRAFIRYQVSGS